MFRSSICTAIATSFLFVGQIVKSMIPPAPKTPLNVATENGLSIKSRRLSTLSMNLLFHQQSVNILANHLYIYHQKGETKYFQRQCLHQRQTHQVHK